MYPVVLWIFLLAVTTPSISAQSISAQSVSTRSASDREEGYQKAMTDAISLLEKAVDKQTYLDCAGRFERISVAEKDRWIPLYYGAYSLIILSFSEEDGQQKDLILDRAQKNLDASLERAPDESELHVLQAFLYPSRILVDPAGRGMEYMGKMSASLERARSLDPENPRIYYLEGVQILNLPPSMGGGAEMARPILETALKYFEKVVAEDPLLPHWGEQATRDELSKLNQ